MSAAATRLRPMLAGLALLSLAGCGASSGDDEKFAPPCPATGILKDAGDLARYRSTGRDITDLVLQGRIIGGDGTCRRESQTVVLTTISVGLELARGPAARGQTAEIAYFVAVSEGERVLDKQVFRINAEFPSNTDRIRIRGEDIELRLPVSAQKSAASYKVTLGFQLTAAELDAARRTAR